MLPNARMTLRHEDAARLRLLLENLDPAAEHRSLDRLADELDRAQLVDGHELPTDVVTVGRRVVFASVPGGRRHEIVLVYPDEANIDAGRVSVLSPVGAALLGIRVGAEISWPLPRGKTGRFRVLEVKP